jgi:hypothetical protein
MDIISTFEAGASSDALASSSTAMTSSADSLSTSRVPDITVSSPQREPVFVKANLDPFRPIGRLGQPPVQFDVPKDGTQVSSRMIQAYDLSSSPPGPVLPQSISPEQLMSPVKHQQRLGEYDDADIEEGAAAAHRRLQQLKDQSYYAGDLTSSAIKGNAAVGLLELMNSRR